MVRIAANHGIAGGERDDVVQEAWGAVLDALPTTGLPVSPSSLRAWLYALVRNKSIDAIRRRQRRPACSLDEVRHTPAEPVDPQADPVRQWERVWQDELVRELLAQVRHEVGEQNYELLYQHWALSRTVADVAAELGLTVDQAKGRLRRLLPRLQARFAVFAGDQFAKAPPEKDPP